MNSGKVLLGLLAGIAAGAAMGILFAPGTGSSTRRKILRKGEMMVMESEDKFNELLDTIDQKFETMRNEVVRMAENGMADGKTIMTKTNSNKN
jgi:gas vesicle protein